MKQKDIHLGFEVGTGKPVAIPSNHLCITGQTQMSGKTTALEALMHRSELKALAFVTKRGEASFTAARHLQPYFREQTDWKYVAAILEASRGEKLKWERAWIIRASKGARTLADVHANVKEAMEKARGQSESAYLCLDAYLDDVVPLIGQMEWAKTIDLGNGINVMALEALNVEMQHLILRSSIEWILNNSKRSLVVVPEAWKFIPQGRGTPVKLAAEAFIRQAAALGNFLWLDSQDIAGIDKIILKSVPVWLLGVQREANEIARTLAQIPAGVNKPTPADIATLELGHFFACWGRHVIKVYVQPYGVQDAVAIRVAKGEIDVRSIKFAREVANMSDGSTQWGVDLEGTDRMIKTLDHAREHNRPVGIGELVKLEPNTAFSPITFDPACPPDKLHLIDMSEYARMPDFSIRQSHLSLPEAVDNRPDSVKAKEQQEIERMDQQERQAYETTISDLRARIEQLQQRLIWASPSLPEAESGQHTQSLPPLREDGATGPLDLHEQVIRAILKKPTALQALATALTPLLPLNGRVVVEPREVVLKEYQKREVERILTRAESLSPWQKEVLRYVEAQGRRCEKVELLKTIKGKTANQVANYKDLYREVDELCNAGWLQRDGNARPSPNLAAHVKASLSNYSPTDADIEDVIGQVLLRLK